MSESEPEPITRPAEPERITRPAPTPPPRPEPGGDTQQRSASEMLNAAIDGASAGISGGLVAVAVTKITGGGKPAPAEPKQPPPDKG